MSENKLYTYIMFYHCVGAAVDKNTRAFVDKFGTKECQCLQSLGMVGGGGMVFTTTHDTNTMNMIISNYYDFKFFLFNCTTGTCCGNTDSKSFGNFSYMLKNFKC